MLSPVSRVNVKIFLREKMKNLILFVILLVFSLNVFAHEGGHGIPTKEWNLKSANEILKADFVKYEQNVVFLRDENQKIVGFNLADFSAQDKKYILGKQELLQSLNSNPKSEPVKQTNSKFNYLAVRFWLDTYFPFGFRLFNPKNKISLELTAACRL